MLPFCSERCQLVDLGRWLSEEYRVPEEPDGSGGGGEAIPRPDDESYGQPVDVSSASSAIQPKRFVPSATTKP